MSSRSKFGNCKAVVDGITFDSRREAKRWGELKFFVRAGDIHSLERQVKFILAESVRYKDASRATPALRYFADFVYITRGGNRIVEDSKGHRDTIYKIKKHLMMTVHGIEIFET